MYETILSSRLALDAAFLLSPLHQQNSTGSDSESDHYFTHVRQSLVGKAHPDEGDAMAALTVVSWVILRGGRGQWQEFLDVACRYADDVLFRPECDGPQAALMQCSPTTRFIIKTSMWYDVVASTARIEVPRFLQVFRDVFDPNHIDGVDGSLPSVPEELSMLPIIGCESHIVWALAEISDLAIWKDRQKERGAFNAQELVNRGNKIETHIMPPISLPAFDSELEHTRVLTSQVFRASARVYLHSVLSGDYPNCQGIANGVKDAIHWLQQVPELSAPSVVRSVAFSICIGSCLTDVPWQRNFLLELLTMKHESATAVGNWAEMKRLIQEIWFSRKTSGYESVNWRDVMRKTEMLLV